MDPKTHEDQIPESMERPIPRFLHWGYLILILWGIALLILYWNGSRQTQDPRWNALQKAADTTTHE